MEKNQYEQLVTHAKTSGYIFQGSEIYGGLANTWDYGPLGVELKNNLKKLWWKKFIQESPYNVGLDAAILMNPEVWEASGHIANFSDPLIDCKECKARHRADKLIEDFDQSTHPESWNNEVMMEFIRQNKIPCPKCGKSNFTDIRQFHLMFKTEQGAIEDKRSTIYLRPETAQGIFVNFKNVQRSMRKKLPFGIGQIGKSFRNEITPGNFIFRVREFEQMELEFFCKPGEDMKWYQFWKDACVDFVASLGIDSEHLRLREHSKEELSFYSKGTCDIEYLFPFGWGEVWGIANRTDYDLKQHMEHSKESLEYLEQETNTKIIPYCIEPSLGVERLFLTVICDAFMEEPLSDGTSRLLMKLHPALAPYKVCVLPLSKQLADDALKVYEMLRKHFMAIYDESGAIGRRYRRQDAIGTPLCVTFDFDSLEDQAVTIRNRDTMEQVRLKIDEVVEYIEKFIAF